MADKITLYDETLQVVNGDVVRVTCSDEILLRNGMAPESYPPHPFAGKGYLTNERLLYEKHITQSGALRILLEFTPNE